VVSALVSAGKLSESEARFSHQRSMVLQAVGAEDDVAVSLSIVEVRRGDRLLICSDGVHGCVFDGAIAAAVREDSLEHACEKVVARANQAGGPDNITAVVAEFSGDDLAEAGPAEQVEFVELDPSETGDDAVTRTSKVARRLAARAGLIDDQPTDQLPATGMYPAILGAAGGPGQRGSRTRGGPAERRWRESGNLGPLVWLAAALAVAAALVLLFWF